MFENISFFTTREAASVLSKRHACIVVYIRFDQKLDVPKVKSCVCECVHVCICKRVCACACVKTNFDFSKILAVAQMSLLFLKQAVKIC